MPGTSNPIGSPIKKSCITKDASPMLNCTAVRNLNAAQVVLPLQMQAGSSAGIYSRQLCFMLKHTRHTEDSCRIRCAKLLGGIKRY